MTDLLPCPFCGGEAHFAPLVWTEGFYTVGCPSCRVWTRTTIGRNGRHGTPAELHAVWNRRALKQEGLGEQEAAEPDDALPGHNPSVIPIRKKPGQTPVNLPFERIPQAADDPGFGPLPHPEQTLSRADAAGEQEGVDERAEQDKSRIGICTPSPATQKGDGIELDPDSDYINMKLNRTNEGRVILAFGDVLAKQGDKVRFLGENGREWEQADARRHFKVGDLLTVERIRVGRDYSRYYFKGIPFDWNTVMFGPPMLEQDAVDAGRDGCGSEQRERVATPSLDGEGKTK